MKSIDLQILLLFSNMSVFILNSDLNSRVSISNFKRKEDAILALTNVKKNYRSAWILTSEQ